MQMSVHSLSTGVSVLSVLVSWHFFSVHSVLVLESVSSFSVGVSALSLSMLYLGEKGEKESLSLGEKGSLSPGEKGSLSLGGKGSCPQGRRVSLSPGKMGVPVPS